MNKKEARIRRAVKCRKIIRRLKDRPRLSVFRTSQHIYAQIIDPVTGKVLAFAGTVEKVFREAHKNTGNVDAAAKLGELIAERAKSASITRLAFDRSGFKYHGRVRALAEAVRAGGLDF